jgi:hypothetical protein
MSSTAVVALPVFKHKVSSVLNKSAEFASKHMFDGNEDTCWNSHQGNNQFILLEFEEPVIPTSVTAVFQGGFVGQDAVIELLNTSSGGEVLLRDLWDTLEDNNTAQTKVFNEGSRLKAKFLRITFPTSTDFYGRVTIYKLSVEGFTS